MRIDAPVGRDDVRRLWHADHRCHAMGSLLLTRLCTATSAGWPGSSLSETPSAIPIPHLPTASRLPWRTPRPAAESGEVDEPGVHCRVVEAVRDAGDTSPAC